MTMTEITRYRERYTPHTLAEAIALLNRPDRRLRPLAGGTRLTELSAALPADGNKTWDGVVDLQGLPLDQIQVHSGWLQIGALVTLSVLAEHAAVRTLASGILPQAIQHEGPRTVRDRATIGGAVALAEPNSELYAALLALDAYVTLHSMGWECTVKLTDLPAVPQGHLITTVQIRLNAARGGCARIVGTAPDQITVAAVAVLRGCMARVALCGVAAHPVLHRGQFSAPRALSPRVAQRRIIIEEATRRALAAAQSTTHGKQ